MASKRRVSPKAKKILSAVAAAIALAVFSIPFAPNHYLAGLINAPEYEPVELATVNQNWSRDQVEWWYYMPQGNYMPQGSG